MKAPKRLISAFLALVMLLALTTTPAFAADTLTGSQIYPAGGWGNGPTLTLTGVVKGVETPIDPSYLYDVEVGGSLVLEMPYPAGKNRSYSIMIGGFYITPDFREPDENNSKAWDTLGETWDIPASSQGGDFDESSGKTRYVYTFTEADMGQKNGLDKIIYPMIYWCDDANNDGQVDSEESDGSVYFGIRVVPAKPAASAGPGGFTDVAASSPYAEAIQWAVKEGITNGKTSTTFAPGETCTVRQILTFLWRANGRPGAAAGTSDLDTAVGWGVENGMINDTASAGDACLRLQAVYFLWKAAGSPTPTKSVSFSDVDASAAYAPAIAWAVEKGITNGISATEFSPYASCTRGQIATFLYRASK